MLREALLETRGLRRTPGFALTSIAPLALGIGATTAVFPALDAIVLRPLPLPRAERPALRCE